MLLAEVPKRALTKSEHTRRLWALEEAAVREGKDVDWSDWTHHHSCNGVYLREFRLPAGHAVTGQVHRYACINIVAKGRVKVIQSDGERVLEAGDIYISGAGEKKALLNLGDEEVVFLTTHATEETDTDKLWEEFTVPPEQALGYQEQLLLEEDV